MCKLMQLYSLQPLQGTWSGVRGIWSGPTCQLHYTLDIALLLCCAQNKPAWQYRTCATHTPTTFARDCYLVLLLLFLFVCSYHYSGHMYWTWRNLVRLHMSIATAAARHSGCSGQALHTLRGISHVLKAASCKVMLLNCLQQSLCKAHALAWEGSGQAPHVSYCSNRHALKQAVYGTPASAHRLKVEWTFSASAFYR